LVQGFLQNISATAENTFIQDSDVLLTTSKIKGAVILE
jgi:hypothetical protein